MGCGTSKAAQVLVTDTDIITKEGHSAGEGEQLSRGEVTTGGSVCEERIHSQGTLDPTPQQGHGSQAEAIGVEIKPSKFDAFEVRTYEDERIVQKGPLPRRLLKMESVPKFTPEMLAEKQRQVEERKKLELEKRATTKLSKKERLRRQVAEARDMEAIGSGERVRENLSVEGALDTESGTASYDPSVEMDTDLTYNTDQQHADFWESSETNSDINEKTLMGKDNDELFNSTDKLEQYL